MSEGTRMPMDYELYDRLAGTWWDDSQWLNLLRSAVNPARFGYMRRILLDELKIDPAGKRTLDVGCGGGLLAEEFARLGFAVTGIDPSEPSLETARAHAKESGLAIEYVFGFGEDLPFDDGSFEILYCCDVLEHVKNLDQTIGEIARVLEPGGVFLYDTINRTLRSKLVMIKVFQDWDSTRLVDPGLHDWTMFIKPSELRSCLATHGLEERDLVGIAPDASPVALFRALRKRRRGEIGYAEFGHTMKMAESRDTSTSYAGYAVKSG
jgi:2-polyprenyl-6-hydroxyphenyl methylase/3-demethylubiquinone-9 3-methyltransferase